MKTHRLLYTLGTVTILALLLLLVRENEGRTAAEAKLKDLRYATESVQNEKENAINGLQVQVSELEAGLNEANAKYDALVIQKNEELAALNARMENEIAGRDESLKKKEAAIEGLETQMKEADDKWSGLLKNKNEEINGLGDQLQRMSAKVAALLKEKQALELRALDCESRSAEFQKEIEGLKSKNASLLREKQNLENQEKPSD